MQGIHTRLLWGISSSGVISDTITDIWFGLVIMGIVTITPRGYSCITRHLGQLSIGHL